MKGIASLTMEGILIHIFAELRGLLKAPQNANDKFPIMGLKKKHTYPYPRFNRIGSVLLFLLFTSSSISASLAEQRIEEYLKIEWRADQVVEQREMLEGIAEVARKETSPVNYFKCQVLLAQLNSGRDFDRYDTHIHLLDSLAKEAPEELGDSLLIEYLLEKANGKLLQRYVDESFRSLVAARELSNRSPETGLHNSVQNMFAYYFLFTAEYQKSLTIKRELHQEIEAKPITDSVAWLKSMGDLAVVESLAGNHQESNRLLHGVVAHHQPGSREMTTIYYRLGDNYLKLMQYDSSEYFLKKAIEVESRDVPGSHFIPVIKHSLARMYSDRGEYARSTDLWEETLPQLDSLKLFRSSATAHLNILLNRLRETSNTAGLEALQSYRLAIDSLQQREKLEREQEFRVKYQSLEKDAEIRELQLEQQEADARLQALVGAILLVVLSLGFILYRIRSRSRITRQQLEIESLKRQALSDELQQKTNALSQQIQLVNERGTVIEELREQLESNQAVEDILASRGKTYIKDQEWDHILVQFGTLHPGILEGLQTRSEKITLGDQKMTVLLRLGYTTASIAEVMNISKDGVRKARQRLKDKVGEDFLKKLTA